MDSLYLYAGLAYEVPQLAVRRLWHYEPEFPCTGDFLCERTGKRHKLDCPHSINWKCSCYQCGGRAGVIC